MAARCRWRACCPARSATASRSTTPEREAGRVSGVFKLVGQTSEKRGAGAGRRDRRARQARLRQDRRHAVGRQAGASRRSPTVDAAIRRCSPSRCRPRSARTTSSSAQALTKLIEEDPSLIVVHNRRNPRGGDVGPGRDASAGRDRAAGRPFRRRRSTRGRPTVGYRETIKKPIAVSAAGTRSSPAATASSATWCSRSSRCRAAPASSSRTRSPAAWCRAITFRRSRRASSTRSSTARSASRWSMSRWR